MATFILSLCLLMMSVAYLAYCAICEQCCLPIPSKRTNRVLLAFSILWLLFIIVQMLCRMGY